MARARKLKLDEYRNELIGGAIELKKILDASGDSGKMESSLRLLRQIEYALWRMERGRYGACVKCEGEISEAVLGTTPWAIFCDDCQRTVNILQTEARARRHAA